MGLSYEQAKALGLGHLMDQAGGHPWPKASRPAADAMNKLERRYSQHLDLRKMAGEVFRWDFQPEKLRLADRTYYDPDFRVILEDGTVEFHETKGFMRDDAVVKLKCAAEQHPYPFVLVREIDGKWSFVRLEAKRR